MSSISPKLRRHAKTIDQQSLRMGKHPDDVAAWLDQFSARELPLIIPLLESLHYVSVERETRLLSRVPNLIARSGSEAPLFCSIGPAYKSSASMLRRLMKATSLSTNNVCVFEDLKSRDISRYNELVFIDDILGTGNQIRGFLGSLPNEVSGGKRVRLVYLCGQTRVAGLLAADHNVDVHILDELPDDFSAFAPNIYPDAERRAEAKAICLSYGRSLEPRMPLGYGDSEFLVAFHDFCPNNTLPIFWSVAHGWKPLFPTPQSKSSTSGASPADPKLPSPASSPEVQVPGHSAVVATDQPTSYGASSFYGRRAELKIIGKWLAEEGCRLVVIWGMAGVGKTKLAWHAMQEISAVRGEGPFEITIWRRLTSPPRFREFLVELLSSLPGNQPDIGDQSEAVLAARLLDHLHNKRCLLVLDELDAVLPDVEMSDQSRDEAQKYLDLLDSIGRSDHQSAVLVTCCEKPPTLAILEGARLSVRSLELTGIAVANVKRLFSDVGRFRAEEEHWRQITTYHAGNPLVLEQVARDVIFIFDGNLEEYLKSDFAAPSSFVERVQSVVSRLERVERQILFWLAVNRAPIRFLELAKAMEFVLDAGQVLEKLASLRRKLRLDHAGDKWWLPPALLNVVTRLFVDAVVSDLTTGAREVIGGLAIMRASSKDYIRDAQRELIAVRILNRLSTNLGSKRSIALHVRALIESELKQKPVGGPYTLGNLLNLLVVLEGGLESIDVSGGTIRELFLRGVTVRNVDFSNCEFSDVALSEAIGGLVACAYRSNGGQFVTGDMNGALHTWEAITGKKTRTVSLHNGWVRSVAYSSDGRMVATAGEDGRVHLRDVESDEGVWKGHVGSGRALAVAVATAPLRVAFGGDGEVVSLATIGSGAPTQLLAGHGGRVWALEFSLCGSRLAVGSEEGVTLWDLSRLEMPYRQWGNLGTVRCLAFSPHDSFLGVGTEEGRVLRLDLSTAMIGEIGDHGAAVRAIRFAADDKHLVTGDRSGAVAVWDFRQPRKVRLLTGDGECIRALSLHAIEPLALSVSDAGFCVWDWEAGRANMSVRGALNSVRAVAGSAVRQAVLVGYEDGSVRHWDLPTLTEAAAVKLHRDRVRTVSADVTFTTFASGGSDRRIFIGPTDLAHTGTQRIAREVPWIRALALSSDGQWLASGGGANALQIWNRRALELQYEFDIESGVITALLFGGDSKSLIFATNSGRIMRRDLPDGNISADVSLSPYGIRALAVVADGDLVAAACDDGRAALIGLSEGAVEAMWDAHSASVLAVLPLVTGESFASCGADSSVKCWSLPIDRRSQPRLIATKYFDSVPTSIAPAGSPGRIAVGCVDGSVRLWNTGGGADVVLAPQGAFAGTNIAGLSGVTEDQKRSLQLLGAISLYDSGSTHE